MRKPATWWIRRFCHRHHLGHQLEYSHAYRWEARCDNNLRLVGYRCGPSKRGRPYKFMGAPASLAAPYTLRFPQSSRCECQSLRCCRQSAGFSLWPAQRVATFDTNEAGSHDTQYSAQNVLERICDRCVSRLFSLKSVSYLTVPPALLTTFVVNLSDGLDPKSQPR